MTHHQSMSCRGGRDPLSPMSWSALMVALLIDSCKICCNKPVPALAVPSLHNVLQQYGHENHEGPPVLGKPRRNLLSDCSETPFCKVLPEGWIRQLNTESDCYFYWNSARGVSTCNSSLCPVVEGMKEEVIVAEEGAWTQV